MGSWSGAATALTARVYNWSEDGTETAARQTGNSGQDLSVEYSIFEHIREVLIANKHLLHHGKNVAKIQDMAGRA